LQFFLCQLHIELDRLFLHSITFIEIVHLFSIGPRTTVKTSICESSSHTPALVRESKTALL
jgi:hypothetical protein